MGRQMLDHIRRSMPGGLVGAAREEARLRAFFGYLNAHPSFYRILYEAEVFAPKAHAEHFRVLTDGYLGSPGRAVARGAIQAYDQPALEAIIYILLAARASLPTPSAAPPSHASGQRASFPVAPAV